MNIVVVDESVRQYLERLKGTSVGLQRAEGDELAVSTLVELGLARIQTNKGRPELVKALPAAWVTVVRV